MTTVTRFPSASAGGDGLADMGSVQISVHPGGRFGFCLFEPTAAEGGTPFVSMDLADEVRVMVGDPAVLQRLAERLVAAADVLTVAWDRRRAGQGALL